MCKAEPLAPCCTIATPFEVKWNFMDTHRTCFKVPVLVTSQERTTSLLRTKRLVPILGGSPAFRFVCLCVRVLYITRSLCSDFAGCVSPYRIATDDQYASNVPDTAHQQPLPLSQRQMAEETNLLSPDDPKGKGGGGAGEGGGGGGSGKEVEIQYLSQLRQSPYPINGVYKLRHNTAHNHFRSPADIKHRGGVCEGVDINVYDVCLCPQKPCLSLSTTSPMLSPLRCAPVAGSSSISAPSWRKW